MFFTLCSFSFISKIFATFLQKWATSILSYEIISVLTLFLAVLCAFWLCYILYILLFYSSLEYKCQFY